MRKDKIAPYLFFPSPAAERDGKKNKKQNGSGLVPLDAAPTARLPLAYSVAPSALLLQLACRLPPASSVRLPPGAAPPLASVLRSGASSSLGGGSTQASWRGTQGGARRRERRRGSPRRWSSVAADSGSRSPPLAPATSAVVPDAALHPGRGEAEPCDNRVEPEALLCYLPAPPSRSRRWASPSPCTIFFSAAYHDGRTVLFFAESTWCLRKAMTARWRREGRRWRA